MADGPWRAAVRRGAAAARANLRPGVGLWIVAGAVVGGYYAVPAVRGALDGLAAWRATVSWWYAIGSTALFGGVLPLLMQRWQRGTHARDGWGRLPFFVLFWGAKGAELEALYRGQAWLFGADPGPWAVAAKVAGDQLLYAPLWAAPSMLIAYRWKDCGFDASAAWRTLDRTWVRTVYLPSLLANWALWVPAVVLIYCLPVALQLPLQNLVLCLAVLIAMILARGDHGEKPAESVVPVVG